MPLLRPDWHNSMGIVIEGALSPMVVTGFAEDNQGVYVRGATGAFAFAQLDEATALETYAAKDVFTVGRDGYYLTLDEARQAIADGVHGVRYVDDYCDEYQDYYVCKDGDPNVPYAEAHTPEPIR